MANGLWLINVNAIISSNWRTTQHAMRRTTYVMMNADGDSLLNKTEDTIRVVCVSVYVYYSDCCNICAHRNRWATSGGIHLWYLISVRHKQTLGISDSSNGGTSQQQQHQIIINIEYDHSPQLLFYYVRLWNERVSCCLHFCTFHNGTRIGI